MRASNLKCGLIGERLGHSFSPLIHACLADYSYTLTEISPEGLKGFVASRQLDAYNVTIPYKKAIMPYLDVISPEATAIGAVNTVVQRDGKLYGYNTDYFGFCYMLDSSGIDPRGKKVLVLGAGGASATVCAAMEDRGASEIITLDSKQNTPENIRLHSDAEIIVNATPVGTYPHNLVSPVELKQFNRLCGVLDLIYNPARTALLLEAEKLGIPSINGLPMLVAQAVRASELFTGEKTADSVCKEIIQKISDDTENIILIGMPGSGKTTAARIIAEKLSRPFLDSDEVFCEKFGRTPAEVITADGEDTFRQMESEVIAELGKQSGSVIACGGGVVTRERNYAPLHQNGVIVFLERALENLSKRGRPISASTSVEEIYNSRINAYNAFADLGVRSTEIPEKTADLIIESVKNRGKI